jgi:hypothetical protein
VFLRGHPLFPSLDGWGWTARETDKTGGGRGPLQHLQEGRGRSARLVLPDRRWGSVGSCGGSRPGIRPGSASRRRSRQRVGIERMSCFGGGTISRSQTCVKFCIHSGWGLEADAPSAPRRRRLPDGWRASLCRRRVGWMARLDRRRVGDGRRTAAAVRLTRLLPGHSRLAACRAGRGGPYSRSKPG